MTKKPVKLCDSNVWLALVLPHHAHHGRVLDWMNGQTLPGTILICRATQQTLLRLFTNRTILPAYGLEPRTNEEAWALVGQLLSDERIVFCPEPSGLEPAWERFGCRPAASQKLWMDAYLAAFAVSGGYQLVTLDRAFRQFDGLDLLVL